MDTELSTLLRQVMDSPGFGTMVDSMKNQLGGSDGNLDLSGVMEKLPALMQMLGPMMQSAPPQPEPVPTVDPPTPEPTSTNTTSVESEPAIPIPKAATAFFKPGSRDKRNKLLSALKPYLSPARCSLVDRAMSAMQLGELLGTVMPGEKS